MQVAHLIILTPVVFIVTAWLIERRNNNRRTKRIALTNYGRYAR